MTEISALILLIAFASYWLQRGERLVARTLALKEADAIRAATLPDKVRVPADLMALADAESEPWAKEQLRTQLRDAYEESGDWNTVRARMAL